MSIARKLRVLPAAAAALIGTCSLSPIHAADTPSIAPATAPATAAAPTPPADGQRTVVRTQDDLPRYSYKLQTPTASALLTDAAAFDALAVQVRKNLESLLVGYDIRDAATLRAVYATLRNLALQRGDLAGALDYSAKRRALEEKPAEKLLSGLLVEAAIAAERAGDDPAACKTAFRAHLDRGLAPLPWATVANEVKAWKGDAGIQTDSMLLGMTQSVIDPAYAEAGSLSQDLADRLINLRLYRQFLISYGAEQIAALSAYIAAHDVAKPDIWAARAVSLAARSGLTPVVVGIWDTGLDTALFEDRLFVNAAETANGRDDDGNGFVDDLHGIGYGIGCSRKVPEPLLTLSPEDRRREPELRALSQGWNDLQANIDSPAASALRQRMASLKPEEAGPLMESATLYLYYGHGTHVAGIAADGNPAIRLLNLRADSPHQLKPPPITRAWATACARADSETIAYFKAHGVRVVNMSWHLKPAHIEASLEANGLGGTPEQRKAEALATYRIAETSLTEAIRSAPEILFVPGAGNDDDDVGFTMAIPAGIDLPNVLTAGGVDRAGDEIDFTAYGQRVRVHAHAYQVDSLVPGGDRQSWSGTSMAAPQVTNLAAKLFALDPALSPADVVQLILDGAERSEDGRRHLIHPQRSVELLEQRRDAATRQRPQGGDAGRSSAIARGGHE